MISISNTNSNGRNRTAVRVYRNGILVAEVFPPKRNPLAYIRKHPKSKYRAELVFQMQRAGLTDEEIKSVVMG